MPTKPTYVSRGTFAGPKTPMVTFLWPENTPHWRVATDGWAKLEVTAHVEAKWLSFHAAEAAKGERGKSDVIKRTMLTLHEKEGRELLAFLKSVYEPEVQS